MRIFVGMWERGLILAPTPEDEHLFRGRRVEAVLVSAARKFYFYLGRGTPGHFCESSRDRNGGRAMRFDLPLPREQFSCRFAIHEVEAFIEDGDLISWVAPKDHLLPWPDHRSLLRYCPELLPEVARRELIARLQSALAVGEGDAKWVVKNTPDWVRTYLSTRDWSECVSQVRTTFEKAPA